MTTSGSSAHHPCLDDGSSGPVGRLHLPIAPRSLARIRFAPSAAGQALTPHDALAWMEDLIEDGTPVDVVGVTGPGDPLATPEPVLAALKSVHTAHPEISLCLATLGLGAAERAEALAASGVSLVTLLIDAVDPAVAEALYAWVRPGVKNVPLGEGVRLLIKAQAEAVKALQAAGVAVKVNTTVYAGVNDHHVESLARTVAALGADTLALRPYRSGEGDGFESLEPSAELMASLHEAAARHIAVAPPRTGCGADVVGHERPVDGAPCAPVLPKATAERPNVAVCSTGGMDVDLHLGHAHQFLIYGPDAGGLVSLLEARPAPEPGTGASRWESAADILHDCFALLAASAGESPKTIFSRRGIRVMVTDAGIEGAVDVLFGGGKKRGKGRK